MAIIERISDFQAGTTARTIMVTGHRPKSMGWGYDLRDRNWRVLHEAFREIIEATGATDAWTGMALGTDTVFARAVLAMKDTIGRPRLHAAIPFEGQDSKWLADSRAEYAAILSRADEKAIVSPGGYAGWKMTARDKYMVDRSDLVVAVWNGKPATGTGRTVEYARQAGKRIVRIDPSEASLLALGR